MSEQHGDAIGTARRIRDGELSSREVVEAAIDRIERYDPQLNAVVGRRFEQALAEVDAGLPDGPLRGVPILIKDLATDVAGLPSTQGSRLFADIVATADSAVVARYRAAGMVVLGSTNAPELGLNCSTEPLLHGSARNPWSHTHSTGGSSGGSAAAVASGMVPVAHGNDGGGSLRIPAAACGLFGLKPSRGRVPSWPYPGALASPTVAHHALTTTVRDSAALLDVVAGMVPGDAYGAPTPSASYTELLGRPLRLLRIGWSTAAPVDGMPVHPACAAAVERAAAVCAELGHQVTEVTLGYDVGASMAAGGVIMVAELAATIDSRLEVLGRELRDDDVEPFTRLLLEHGRAVTGPQVIAAMETVQRIGWQVGKEFDAVDVLLMPTLAQPTPVLGLLDTTAPGKVYQLASVYSAFTSIFNVTGMPAMSVPFGVDDAGLPLGAQFVAELGQEDLLLRLARQLEIAAPWPLHAPDYAPG